MKYLLSVYLIILFLGANAQNQLLLETEGFKNPGGWKIDQQFTHLMGSNYLLAHGMGVPVENASTKVKLPAAGEYRVWVRTKDWVPEHEQTPGTFKVELNGTPLSATFGTNKGWNWVDGGVQSLSGDSILVELNDLTGFEGRCDAIFLTTDVSFTPPNDKETLAIWRRKQHNLPEVPAKSETFDVVIIGGGMGGCSAAIAAAREGCSVALIQDRPVLGGNASKEIRVHTIGMAGFRIVDEINTDHYPNGSDEAIQSTVNLHDVMENEPNVNLFLSTRAFAVNKSGRIITSVDATNIASGEEIRFFAKQFIDCTGDGWIGYWAGNRFMIGREAKEKFDESLAPETEDGMMMGSTVMFTSENKETEQTFPEVPWAMDVAKDYSATKNEWYWEYGVGLDPFADAEHIRDHLLRAIYGAFYNAKQNPENSNRKLNWVGYVMGKRESRRLVGEHILTEKDVRNSVDFEDGVVVEKREIDLHLPKSDTYDFLTKALFTKIELYHLPFRSLIAADLDNLMMAGRCLSASHVGLGSPRVMNTIGQMGVATGCAAALCKKYNTYPRGVYSNHLKELKALVGIDQSLIDDGEIYDNAGSGVIINGEWLSSTYNSTYYGTDYIHDKDEDKGEKSVTFSLNIAESGNYKLYTRHTTGSTRSTKTPFDIKHANGTTRVLVNQRNNDGVWVELGTFYFNKGEQNTVTISNEGTDGHVIVDAISLVPEINTALKKNIKKQEGISSIKVNSESVLFTIGAGINKGILRIYSISGCKMAHIPVGNASEKQFFEWKYSQTSGVKGVFIAQLLADNCNTSRKFFLGR